MKNQKGFALVLAMLIVAMVTTIVVSVSWRYKLSAVRNENRWHGSQARAYLEAAEVLTKQGLQADLQMGGKIDHLGEMWAQEAPPYPTDEGWVRGKIEDAHSRLNLNLLVPPPPPPPEEKKPPERWSATQERFIRLLQVIELEGGNFLDESKAIEIAEAVQDWIDQDSNPTGFGGAEANFYQSQDPPYPIANKEMKTVSELSIVKGMTPELYEKLVPYVIALPGARVQQDARVYLNVNTMKPLLMRALNRKGNLRPLEIEEAQFVQQEIMQKAVPPPQQGGIQSVEEFVKSAGMQAVYGGAEGHKDMEMTVSANYFLLFTETLVGEQVRRGRSLMYRAGNGNVDTIRRTDANF